MLITSCTNDFRAILFPSLPYCLWAASGTNNLQYFYAYTDNTIDEANGHARDAMVHQHRGRRCSCSINGPAMIAGIVGRFWNWLFLGSAPSREGRLLGVHIAAATRNDGRFR
jgi:hypothetical protein